MDTVSNVKMTMEERIDGAVRDNYDVLYRLTQSGVRKGSPIEIVTELPAAVDTDLVLSYVMRWNEVQKFFCSDLRVYAWSHNPAVEKYFMSCVQNMSHIFVTILPINLKENFNNGS